MKKLLILAVFTIGAACELQAQKAPPRSAYQDALYLKTICDTDGKFSTETRNKPILSYYFPNKTGAQIDSTIQQNPFLAPYHRSGGAQGTMGFSLPGALQSIGGLNVTSIADGIAQFLIKRGKEELDIAFFQRMKTFISNHPECETLLPATSEFLENINTYQYSEFLQSMRTAFQTDLNNLIVNLNLFIDLPKYQALLKEFPEIQLAIRSAAIVSELSDSSVHPVQLINQFATLPQWYSIDSNLGNAWRLLDVISQSLQDTTSKDSNSIKHAWISIKTFNNMLKDTNHLKIYLGLVYERSAGITFKIKGSEISVQQFMKNNQQNMLTLANLFENFLLLAKDVDQTLAEIKQKKQSGTAISNDDYYNYINKAINLLEYGFKVANAIKPGIADNEYIVMARNADNLYKNIYTKNYSAAVMNAYLILNEILVKSKDKSQDKLQQYNDSMANTSDPVAKAQLKMHIDNLQTVSDSITDNGKVVAAILKYGNMMASIIKADSPEDVENAIESAALPAGSSSIKKTTSWNVALNAYIGYYRGASNGDNVNQWNYNRGITAPIGITLSKGLGYAKIFGKPRNLGALSAYITILNVGSIVDYRLSDDSSSIKQEIKLENIISPGGYLIYGLPTPLPISFGYGAQYGPTLYKVTSDNVNVSDKPGWRSHWFIAIDIPLINFWSKNYAKSVQ